MVTAAILGAAVTAAAESGASSFLQRPRFPRVDVAQILSEFQDVRSRGNEPVLSRDPLTGEFVISTANQADAGVVDSILLDRFLRPSGISPRIDPVSQVQAVVAQVEATRMFRPANVMIGPGFGRCAGATTAAQRAICAAGGTI